MSMATSKKVALKSLSILKRIKKKVGPRQNELNQIQGRPIKNLRKPLNALSLLLPPPFLFLILAIFQPRLLTPRFLVLRRLLFRRMGSPLVRSRILPTLLYLETTRKEIVSQLLRSNPLRKRSRKKKKEKFTSILPPLKRKASKEEKLTRNEEKKPPTKTSCWDRKSPSKPC